MQLKLAVAASRGYATREESTQYLCCVLFPILILNMIGQSTLSNKQQYLF